MALALTNGRIYTVDPSLPWAEAVLIEDRRFTLVGTEEEVRAAAPPGTEFIDLQGRMAMPGLHDAHTHLLFSGLKFKYEARLTPGAGPDQIKHDLADCKCAELVADGEQAWIVGGEFLPSAFNSGELDRRFLDEAFPDQPVFLYDYTIHHAFVNSKALELAGLDEHSQDPPGGRLIRRQGSRELTGEIVEHARWPVMSAMPDYRADVYRDALKWAVSVCHKFGITSIQEASASPQALVAYRDIDQEDGLDLHVAAHLVWREEGFGMASTAELDRTIADREAFVTEHLNPRFIKIWLDGAPLPPHMTQADLDENGKIISSNVLVEPEQLADVIGRFDAAGLAVKIHCAGEGSAKAAFDAFQAVRESNGPNGPQHEIAHCTYIHDSDYQRFREHNVVAEMSPAIWHIEEYGLQDGYKFRTILDAGATMTVGSDWIITPDPNLFPAVQGMLERGNESVDLATVIEILTIGGARVVGRGEVQGSISVGKSADLIVLDRNLFEVPTGEIGATTVVQTIFEGRAVYQADAQPAVRSHQGEELQS